MLTNSGAELAIGVTWCVVGVIALVMTVRQFLQKGSLFSVVYLWASKEERERLQQKKLYKASGGVFLYVTLISLLLGLFFIFDMALFASCAAIMALSGLLIVLLRFLTKD